VTRPAPGPLKSVDAHLADVLSAVQPLGPLELQLLDAHGCVLAEDVSSPVPLPPFDNSGMDGYAVRRADVRDANPLTPMTLPVAGDIAAGSVATSPLPPGGCMRIMTGAKLPAEADAIVPLEWTDGGESTVTISRAPAVGQHVRRAGEEVAAGDTVLSAGTFLGAAQLGLLAAVGRDAVRVRPRPRIVVISTGSELAEVGGELEDGQIYDSNSYALTAAAREAGATPYRIGIVPDDPDAFEDTLEDQLIRADAVITSGGVSVGAYDVVKEVLSRLGTVRFERVAMQPGMPQGFGTLGAESVPFFGLPGNPVSAFVSFEVFVRPALRRMLGADPLTRPQVEATLTAPVRSPAGKRAYLRARLALRDGQRVVTPVGGAGSHLVAGLAAANALIVVPEDVTDVGAGAVVSVLLLERRQR